MPATSSVTDDNGIPTGEHVPFDEDVVLVEMKEQQKQPDDTWADTGRVFSVVVEDPVADQRVSFETEPQTWPIGQDVRWLGRVIDGYLDRITNEFKRVEFQTYPYPWSDPSWE